MQSRDYEAIRVELTDRVATITLNRPQKKNALNQCLINEMLWALEDADADTEVRAIVLCGAGGSFSAGADLKGMQSETGGMAKKGEFPDLLQALTNLGTPTVAKIEGYAMAGALGLVACCDFAIASESAIFGTPEIKRGLFPLMIAAVLQRVVPQRKLVAMMLLGERLNATQALDYGLLTEKVPDTELNARVDALSKQLASQSPTAMRIGLHAINEQRDMPLDEALTYLNQQLLVLIGSDDAKEGLKAFFEKRDPNWPGR